MVLDVILMVLGCENWRYCRGNVRALGSKCSRFEALRIIFTTAFAQDSEFYSIGCLHIRTTFDSKRKNLKNIIKNRIN